VKISTTHQKFADQLGDQTALEYPERFLGPNWKDFLNFWIYLDTLSAEKRKIVSKRYSALADTSVISLTHGSHWVLTWNAAQDIIGNECVWSAFRVIGSSVNIELIASHKLESLKFLPLFLNL